MTDFSKAVIYNIYCKDKNVLEFYIGSTHDEIQREQGHKDNCNNEKRERHYNLKVYKFIRDNGGWDNWIFKVIQEFPCENKIQLVIQEQYHYDLLKPALNSQRSYISEEEIKEERKEYKAKYYQDNIEEIKEKKAKHYQDNIEEIKEKKAKYYEDNRDEILKRNNQKHNCECGGKYTTGCKAQHLNTNKHKNFLKNQEEN